MTIIDAILANHIAVTNRADVVIREAEEEVQKASRYKVRSNFIAPHVPRRHVDPQRATRRARP